MRKPVHREIGKRESGVAELSGPKYGATLLLWAVGMEKYKSAEALLKCGADPNLPQQLTE